LVLEAPLAYSSPPHRRQVPRPRAVHLSSCPALFHTHAPDLGSRGVHICLACPVLTGRVFPVLFFLTGPMPIPAWHSLQQAPLATLPRASRRPAQHATCHRPPTRAGIHAQTLLFRRSVCRWLRPFRDSETSPQACQGRILREDLSLASTATSCK
jgi:hypothetical protein